MKNHPKISLIAAISENRVIGKDNKLPWHIPEDLKRFKELTNGHPVIMGRKTFESIGRLLPDRVNIIITRDENYFVEGALVVNSLDTAVHEAKSVASSMYQVSSMGSDKNDIHNSKYIIQDTDKDEIFVIGGGQIFEQAIKIADKLYLTIVHTTIDGDAFFPDYSEFNKELYRQDSANDTYTYTFLDLERSPEV